MFHFGDPSEVLSTFHWRHSIWTVRFTEVSIFIGNRGYRPWEVKSFSRSCFDILIFWWVLRIHYVIKVFCQQLQLSCRLIRLMYKYITHSKFTTNPHLRSTFSHTSNNFVFFSPGHSFHLCRLRSFATNTSANCILKARLGSEICLSKSYLRASVGQLPGKTDA